MAIRTAAVYRDKQPEAIGEAIELLRASAVPMPADLREFMLAEFTAESARVLWRRSHP